jgi:hypothetical protein
MTARGQSIDRSIAANQQTDQQRRDAAEHCGEQRAVVRIGEGQESGMILKPVASSAQSSASP